jgi:predicted Zn-dependent protease
VSVIRVSAAVAGVIVCAWFALGIHQAHEVARATSMIDSSRALTVTQDHAIESWLDSAQTLNPDRQVEILRAQAAIKVGQARRAQQILTGVTRAEPLNLDGWIWLAGASLGDPPLARRALRRIDMLDPRARQQL